MKFITERTLQVKEALKPVDKAKGWLVAHKKRLGQMGIATAIVAGNLVAADVLYTQHKRISVLEQQNRQIVGELIANRDLHRAHVGVICEIGQSTGDIPSSVNCGALADEVMGKFAERAEEYAK